MDRPVVHIGATTPLQVLTPSVTIWRLIKTFSDRDTERLFARQAVRRWSVQVQRTARRKLVQIEASEQLEDLRVPPGNRLEKLRGDRAGQCSIRINDQWRICFRWRNGDAYDVEITDYHRG